jgi:serine/threonine-protein kinase RsbW
MQNTQIGLYAAPNWTKASLVIASNPDGVSVFMQRLLKLLSANSFQANDQFGIQLAVEEALVNAIKHGNQMDRNKRVHPRIVVGSKAFRIRIRDEGSGFDPDGVPNPTDSEFLERPTGRGLWLMRHYMHTVRFNAKGNEVTLVRELSPAL